MFFYFLNYGQHGTVTQRLALTATGTGQSPAIASQIAPFPITYAETPTGYVFMANGFMPMLKWDGVAYSSLTVGVAKPTTAVTITATGTGTITGTYTAYARWVDKDGNPSNLSPISNELVMTNAGGVAYSGVPTTSDPKVTTLQILRNTSGQTSVYYVDVETTDLTGTTFSSTNDDTTLSVQESVPFFDDQGRSIANRFGLPPDHKPYIVPFQGRVFAMGDLAYTDGHIEVTFGSASVSGIGTAWTSSMVGRFLYIVGVPNVYQIDSVDVDAQTLTLTDTYKDPTDYFGVYAIRTPPAQRRLVYFCEATSYDAWPATNALEIEENGDDVTGGAATEGFLFVLQRRHVYRLTYNANPLTDGGLFLASERGCINQRCVVKVGMVLYMLDEQGVYKLAAGGDAQPISNDIQDMWRREGADNPYRINWTNSRYFHAILDESETTIRWVVALDGSLLPKHAICFNYGTPAIWVEPYPHSLGASCLWLCSPPRPLVAGPAKKVFALSGVLDGVRPSGTTRGTVTSATYLSLTDRLASFQDLTSVPVSILDGTGKGQQRRITVNTATMLTIDRPWVILPDETSVYQVGGIPWLWRGTWSRWLDDDMTNARRVVLTFKPCDSDNQIDVRVFRDRFDEPMEFGYDWPPTPDEADAVTVRSGDTALRVNLTQAAGFAQIRMNDRRQRYIQRRDNFSIEMSGVSGESPVRLYEMIVEGAKE